MWNWIIDVIFVRKYICEPAFSRYFVICLLVWFWESISSVGECCVTTGIIYLVVLSEFYCDGIRKLIYCTPHVHHFTYDFCFKIKIRLKHMIQSCLYTSGRKSCYQYNTRHDMSFYSRVDLWSSLDWSWKCLFCSGPWKRWGQKNEWCWSVACSGEPIGGQTDSGSQNFCWKLRYCN